MKAFATTLGAVACLFGTPPASATDPLQVRSWAAACANCHGTTGQAQSGMESLAGRPAAETAQKLNDYKTGRKPATVMHQLAKGYSDEQIDQIAAWFAAQKK